MFPSGDLSEFLGKTPSLFRFAACRTLVDRLGMGAGIDACKDVLRHAHNGDKKDNCQPDSQADGKGSLPLEETGQGIGAQHGGR